MEDRRVQKSRDAIQSSFLALLGEKRLNKITVSEICRMANVGRGTFYLHYLDVYDLYDKIEGELYAGLYRLFEDAFPSTDRENSRKLSEALTGYVEQHKERFLLLTRVDNRHSLQRLQAVFNEKVQMENQRLNPLGNQQYETMEAIFVVSGMVGVLEQWLTDGMKIPRSEIAKNLDKILCKINAPAP